MYDITWDKIPEARALICTLREHPDRMVAITGAGISVASGIPLLKGTVGGKRVEALFQREFWMRSPRDYFHLYKEVLLSWRAARPNLAHLSLAQFGSRVITLNIDGLQRDAGSRGLIELHGNLRELRCESCGVIYQSHLALRKDVPRCPSCQLILIPGFTFPGEEVRHVSLASDWIGMANILLVIGTTLHSDPIRQLYEMAHHRQIPVIAVNSDAERMVPRMLARA